MGLRRWQPIEVRSLVCCTLLFSILAPINTKAQEPLGSVERPGVPGQFFRIDQPISSESVSRFTTATKSYLRDAAVRGEAPVMIFEIRPGETDYGIVIQLTDYIATSLEGARKTVAYVPEPLSGYGALVALACDEIVLGSEASLGPITPVGTNPVRVLDGVVTELARNKGRPPDLIRGMLDPSLQLYRVETPEGNDYVLEQNIDEFEQTRRILNREPAWGRGARGKLSASRARDDGLVQSLAENRQAIAVAYGVTEISDDPTLGAEEIVPIWIRVTGAVTRAEEAYLKRQISLAEEQGKNLLFLELNSPGGDLRIVDDIATSLSELDRIKTVAYINDQATGVAVLLAFGCDEIVFRQGGRLGNVDELIPGRNSAQPLTTEQQLVIEESLVVLAKRNGYAPAVAKAMVDPDMELVSALDQDAGAVILTDRSTVDADRDRFANVVSLKSPDELLTVTDENAAKLGLTRLVVADDESLKQDYGLTGVSIPVNGPSWVDRFVSILNTPFMGGFLLFLGFLMLVLEMKLPGIGLPAITATLSFLLFFWSRYLGGTADGLEVILFLVGLICLALEIFVFPGFGVFGMSGVILILVSIVMASHTFIWPSDDSQYRQMGQTLTQVVVSLVAVVGGIIALGRYFPSLPFFNKLVLRASTPASDLSGLPEKPVGDSETPMAFLLGETGRTTSVLRPSGKARFGELLVDVTADGFFIEPDRMIQVVDVQGARVIVKAIEDLV